MLNFWGLDNGKQFNKSSVMVVIEDDKILEDTNVYIERCAF